MTKAETKEIVCIHPKYNLAVKGKLRRVPVGERITKPVEQANALIATGKFKEFVDKEAGDFSDGSSKESDAKLEEAKTILAAAEAKMKEAEEKEAAAEAKMKEAEEKVNSNPQVATTQAKGNASK